MIINVEFWHLVGLLLSFLGCCFGFAKILVAQFQSSLSERYQNQQKVNEKVDMLERDLNQLKIALPHSYVLREDYIRGQAILEAKLDAQYEKIDKIYQKGVTQ